MTLRLWPFFLAATLILGVYPRPLFEFAEISARTLGVAQVRQAIR